jgi:hypothetical protein
MILKESTVHSCRNDLIQSCQTNDLSIIIFKILVNEIEDDRENNNTNTRVILV